MSDNAIDKAHRHSETTRSGEARQSTTTALPMRLLYVLIGLCFCIAWFGPVRDALAKRMWPPAKVGPRNAHDFIALAYVADEASHDDEISIAQMDKHLDALVANGYSCITLRDAIGLIQMGTPVPTKAVLLTIDTHKRSVVSEAKSVLRSHGWNAVMFVPTRPVDERRKGSVSWSHLRGLDDATAWEVCSLGHNGAKVIETEADGSTGHYLTSPQWLNNANRKETLAELQTRVVQDHNTSRALIEEHLGQAPRAYAYPFGDFGQFQHPDDYAGHINLAAASSIYDLAFIRGGVGLNTMFSDVSRLNRMRVHEDWSPADLINAIEANRVVSCAIEDTDLTRKTPGWISDWGEMSPEQEGVRISASPKTRGGRAWLAGSDLRRDLSATVRLSITEGDAAIYLRAAPDDSAFVVLQLAPNGETSVRQKESWESPIVTLATTRAPIRLGRVHTLDVFLRDRHFDVLLDGNPLFPKSIRLEGDMEAGRLGIGTTANVAGKANILVSSATVQSRRSTLASWTMDREFEPYIMDWLHQHAGRLTELSPPWSQVQTATAQFTTPDTATVYRRLTKMYNLRLMPKVEIASDDDLNNWAPTRLAEQVAEADCDGLYVNFERHTDLRVAPLENWLRQASKMLSGYGRPLLVRLPPMLERLAAVNALIAVIPAVEIVTGARAELPIATMQAQAISEELIPQPEGDAVRALPVAFSIADEPGADEATSVRAKVKQLRDQAEAAFHRGAYEKAIATFSEWHQLEPSSPRPLTRIGDALISLGYHDEAVGFYHQSLALAPGQVDLAVRQARLLTNLNRRESSKDLLNAYARLFPNNTDILFAQAEWLYRQDRSAEAQTRISRILALDEYNFDASLFLLRLATDESSRQRAVDRLMTLSTTPDRHYDLANAVWQYDLLTLPDSHLLVTMLEDISTQSEDTRVQTIISKLRPRIDSITESFDEATGLSSAWHIEGATTSIDDGQLTILANPTREEFTVRLLRSERWRDSFIEADITDVEGGFWLYGRRSRNHLVRFGFDANSDRAYLQAWKGKNNDVVLNQFVPWTKPDGKVTLRLEVRGNGIIALINNKSIFDVPLAIPGDFGLGWVALAVNSRDRGKGSVTLSRLQSGPLPVRLAMLPAAPDPEEDSEELVQLRKHLGSVTDFSPDWFAIDEKGAWSSETGVDDDFFRLFSRYYRIRLVPTVRVSDGAKVLPSDILTVTRTHNFDGLVLLFETMPPESWFESMDRQLGSPGLDLLAVALDDMSNVASMRGIAASRTLFQGARTVDDVPVVDCQGAVDGEEPETTGRAVLLF